MPVQRMLQISLLLLVLTHCPSSRAADGNGGTVESGVGVLPAVESAEGYSIVPAPDAATSVYTEDLSPPQVVEVVRPGMEAFTVGRIVASCTCLKVSAKRSYAAGERAFIEVRNVKPTQKDGALYAIFIEITTPVRVTLQHFIFVKSEIAAAPPSDPHFGETFLAAASLNPAVPIQGHAYTPLQPTPPRLDPGPPPAPFRPSPPPLAPVPPSPTAKRPTPYVTMPATPRYQPHAPLLNTIRP
ncbi:MAG: hypothetical protein LIP23_04020 [Planctomycetes bacterium]|nr:hypothetical protein [Planctomycetota bacterium]